MRYEKQANILNVFTTAKHHGTEGSFHIAHCIAKYGKPFTDGEFIKEAFLCNLDGLFDGLPNKDTHRATLQNISVPAGTVELRTQEMGDTVIAQQTDDLKDAQLFSVALE